MRTSSKIALAGAVVILTGVSAWALRAQPVAVETGQVARGEFEQVVSDDGKTRVRERYAISAPLAGRAQRSHLKVGDLVRVGDVVAILAPSIPVLLDARTERELNEHVGVADAQRLRAVAQVQRADAQLAQARVERERTARLSREGFVSATVREQAELALRTAEKELDAANFAEHAAAHEAQLARTALVRYKSGSEDTGGRGTQWTVRSPVQGVVLRLEHESEGVVGLGAPLLELADIGSLEAVVDILSQDAVAIVPGMQARVEFGAGISAVPARVRLVEPAAFTKISALGVEEQRVNVVLEFTGPVDRIPTIGDGFRIEAHIVVFHATDCITIPVAALFRDDGNWAVFVVNANRAEKRTVKIARRNDREALVESGLQPGETVAVYPSDLLHDGARTKMLKQAR